jgi:hypothetical protein
MTIKLPKPACPKSGTRQPEDLYTHAQLVQAVKDALEEAAVIAHSCIGPAPFIRQLKEQVK